MLSKNALKILEKRYYLRDKSGNLLEKSPEDLFHRVAKYISSAELNYSHEDPSGIEEDFYIAMLNQEFMPASPVLFNAGTDNPMLSSCFGIEVEDNLDSIFQVMEDSAKIFKAGGGVGWNFSKVRGKGAKLSTGGTSSGVCSFITLYDTMIGTIKQGGKRRGAGAVILDVIHPDILEFINSKKLGVWNNLNISVICTDDFMNKVNTTNSQVWEELINANWAMGDPNIVFIDSMNKFNSLPKYPINVVNPCHEIPMSSYESCNLAGINLDKCLKGEKRNIKIDWDKLGKLVKLGHRFLDNMIDVNKYPLERIKDFALKTRRQGLYVFGLAPVLIRMGYRYGSQESLDLIDNLFCFINRVSLETCIELGKIRGNFPEFESSTYYNKYKYMRCSHRLTIAPSGTTSRIADSYFSIEPYYAFDYISNIMDEQIEEKIELKDEYKDIYPEAIITAHEIKPEEHLIVMATIQKWIDQAISKTINLPFHATKEDISQAFKLAYKLGLKCVTTFRDNCRNEQVLEVRKFANTKRKEYIRIAIDKDLLGDLYTNKGYSQTQIAELLGVSRGVVVRRLKECGVPSRTSGGKSRYIFHPQYETIIELHNKGISLEAIATIFDHEKTFIQEIIGKHGGVSHNINRSIPITTFLIEFIEGELLGDGCIMSVDVNSNMAYYKHSSKYREYVEWLDYIFSSEGLFRSGKIVEDISENGTVYRFSTIGCIELMELRKRWYPDGIKKVPSDLILTPTIIRQWYIGDGTLRNNGLALCTMGFDDSSIQLLKDKLYDLGFITNLWADKRIYLPEAYFESFIQYMDQSFYANAPCYGYKFKGNEPECRSGVCEI